MADRPESKDTLRRVERIPLDIVVTATGARTPDVIVAVLASDLDALETRLWELNNLAASVASHFEDKGRGLDVAKDEADLHDEAHHLWDRTWLATTEIEAHDEANATASQSGSTTGVSDA